MDAETFWSKVDTTGECWLWLAARIPPYGYGNFGGTQDGVRWVKLAHRHAYELAHGPIPEGMWVLHRCDNPPCVRPDHLFLGTHADNMRDMVAKGRHWATKKTHCKHGHPFEGDNLSLLPNGERVCLTCRRERLARFEAKKLIGA